jgi:signal transduction histidine kinase
VSDSARRPLDAPVPLDAPARLDALAETYLMDSPADEDFDRSTRLVRRSLGVPVSLVSLVDDRRQFFKSAVGLPEPWASRRQTPLSHSFCQHVITSGQPLVVEDAATDERVLGNGAIEDLGVGAYLGVPVRTPDGAVVGTLCAIDDTPRPWSVDDLALLTDLAAGVTAQIGLRVHATRLESLARSAAHELRTPLSAVRVRLEDVASWSQVPGDVRAELTATLDQVIRLSGQLDEHLELVRTPRHGGGPEAALDELLRQVTDRWREEAAARGRDLTVTAPTPVWVAVPPPAVTQVLDLLLEDALEGGDGAITIDLADERGAVRLRVCDHPRHAADVPPPARSHPPGGRSGMTLAEQLARTFGGRLVVTHGEVTTRELLLPRAD